MNEYEARKQARIDRYKARADKAEAEATSRHAAAREIQSYIPLGQPILVGHHSEKRHRADLARIDRNIGKAVEATAKAKHYEEKAEAAENNTAISADDPEAVDKLREKAGALEAYQAELRSDNAKLRKAKLTPDISDLAEAMRAAGVSEHGVKSLCSLARISRYHCEPFVKHPGYELSNNNANLKRVRQRIANLEAKAAQADEPEAEPIKGAGFAISEDREWGRILIDFGAKPAAEVRTYLKSHGWRWAPSRSAWVRHLNTNGRAYAELAAQWLHNYHISQTDPDSPIVPPEPEAGFNSNPPLR